MKIAKDKNLSTFMLAACFSLFALTACGDEKKSMVEWVDATGDERANRYSPADNLTRENVGKIARAWEWKSPDKAMPEKKLIPGNFTGTPIMVDGTVYMITNYYRVVALDAETGKEKWLFDPHAYEDGPSALGGGYRPRGVAIWRDQGKLRIFVASRNKLIALDAETGQPVTTFGQNGVANAAVGLSRDTDSAGNPIDPTFLEFNDTPTIYKDLVILGTATGDRVYGKDPAGAVRAFDARSGALVWTFHMIPQPGTFGNDTWLNDSWKTMGSNDVWAGISVDAQRGLLYVPGGNPSNPYYGGKRLGNTLFAQSLICLDAATGQRKWHYQTIHHDVWDYDLPAKPNLFTIEKDGKKIDVVAQLTKQGLIFVFDRVTGEPIWPIEERPVPQSDVPGEVTSPTQPFPVKPDFVGVGHGVAPEDAFDLTPEAKAAALEQMQKFRIGPIYTPPSLEGTLTRDDGPNWGGGAYDPETNRFYIRTGNRFLSHKLDAYDPATTNNPFAASNVNVGYEQVAGESTRTKLGLPILKPPYGTLTAVNMNTGDILWKVPMGKGSDSIRNNAALKDVKVPERLGDAGLAGAIVTKGGLVFAGGSDQTFYAFDKETGAEVWQAPLGRPATGTPMTYRTKSGRQFVLVATGSADDAMLVAFALPTP